MNHDRSKFSEKQFYAYIELTEYYRQRKKLNNLNYTYPEGVEAQVREAIEDHYKNENHHPEMYPVGSMGKWDRYQAIECVCDLQAMAQEYNEGVCRKYFQNIWLPKYFKESGFYDDYNWFEIQVWMDETIECFEDDYFRT